MNGTPEDDPRLVDPALRRLVLGEGAEEGLGLTEEGRARLVYWQAATGGLAAPDPAIELCLARLILAHRGEHPATLLRHWRGAMLAQAASAARAMAAPAPSAGPEADGCGCAAGGDPVEAPAGGEGGHATRQTAGPGGAELTIERREHPWRGFFGLEVIWLRHRRRDGEMSGSLRREAFLAVDAATVLPYDTESDRVLVIEQLRIGPLARGAPRPWLLEAIAGRVDPGETPEETVRREAREEAGLTLGPLVPVAGYYPSPGALSEYVQSFVAPVSLEGVSGGVHGLRQEGEDIRSLVLPLDEAMAMLDAGTIVSAPLVVSLLWLDRARARQRRGLTNALLPRSSGAP